VEAFLVSLSTVAIAEMGDRTQLLALVLAAKFRKPVPIVVAILIATLANHAIAGFLGVISRRISSTSSSAFRCWAWRSGL
jgi:putative Ca2+/H+ antiporter (TMEM165/GDT1 family)